MYSYFLAALLVTMAVIMDLTLGIQLLMSNNRHIFKLDVETLSQTITHITNASNIDTYSMDWNSHTGDIYYYNRDESAFMM